jgi:hypothetical protein
MRFAAELLEGLGHPGADGDDNDFALARIDM